MLRALLLTVVAVLLAGVSTPRSVEASCGDWLQHSGSASMSVVEPPAMRSSDLKPIQPGTPLNGTVSHGGQESAGQSIPVKPCDGPLCGQLPTLPVQLPTVPPAERPHHDAIWKQASPGMCSGQFLCRLQDGSADVQPGFSLGIDRPPQMTLSLA
ncbi:hypothetical protein [Rhodopirellula baltica]|uniref:Uncharacterized protein n=1 Tax=Rhodopirellula baltica (strain DSM 10527 / NCIMB 13988 / SH1) TaxID=243090 RepID=Q7UJT0_RHOBA|nr:hypothetical protein [Rhodopirellula baltica]CAD77151.1 hypothetical protein-transmembrane prediction [Rhodopirellula baltica SH 1]